MTVYVVLRETCPNDTISVVAGVFLLHEGAEAFIAQQVQLRLTTMSVVRGVDLEAMERLRERYAAEYAIQGHEVE